MRHTVQRVLTLSILVTLLSSVAVAAPAEAKVNKHGAWVQVKLFIPQKRINAPIKGCDYGTKYQFGGDSRGYSATNTRTRVTLTANLRFDKNKPRLTGSSKSIGATTVYRKSTGRLVAKKTASASRVTVKQLPLTDKNKLDLRFSIHASNPFCKVGAASGAFTMTVFKDGRYVIRSGAHRQAPNWEIYAGWINGPATTVYRRSMANIACLVAMVCSEAQMGGYSGKLRG